MVSFRRISAALVIAALPAACVQSGAGCGREEERELRTVDRLIAETRTDMARGYTREPAGGNVGVNFCLGGGGSNVGVSFCADPSQRTRPVPVDMQEQERKLQALETRRLALLSGIDAKQARCAATGGF